MVKLCLFLYCMLSYNGFKNLTSDGLAQIQAKAWSCMMSDSAALWLCCEKQQVTTLDCNI